MPEVIAIIPARYNSVRFPGKVLADIHGKPLIRHVYERVSRSSAVSRVAVATDDERVACFVKEFGGTVIMTSPEHKTGTDRVAEAAAKTGGDIIVNVQGDEPLIDPGLIDKIVEKLVQDDGIVCSTAAFPVDTREEYLDPNCVKVVCDADWRALYFSRSPIPFFRDKELETAYIHIGIYCFRKSFLDVYATLKPGILEAAEKLEQLRILEHGYRIGIVSTRHKALGIDTREDLEKVIKLME